MTGLKPPIPVYSTTVPIENSAASITQFHTMDGRRAWVAAYTPWNRTLRFTDVFREPVTTIADLISELESKGYTWERIT